MDLMAMGTFPVSQLTSPRLGRSHGMYLLVVDVLIIVRSHDNQCGPFR